MPCGRPDRRPSAELRYLRRPGVSMRRALRTAAGAALVLVGSSATSDELFDLQKLADGVYAAIARPRTPINCNAAVIVYDEGVLVVDTHSRPSSARR